jgi:hypothetical protein
MVQGGASNTPWLPGGNDRSQTLRSTETKGTTLMNNTPRPHGKVGVRACVRASVGSATYGMHVASLRPRGSSLQGRKDANPLGYGS